MIKFVRPVGHAARGPSRSVLEHYLNVVVIRSRAHDGENILVVKVLAVGVICVIVMVVVKMGMMMAMWNAIILAPNQEEIVLSKMRLRMEHAWVQFGQSGDNQCSRNKTRWNNVKRWNGTLLSQLLKLQQYTRPNMKKGPLLGTQLRCRERQSIFCRFSWSALPFPEADGSICLVAHLGTNERLFILARSVGVNDNIGVRLAESDSVPNIRCGPASSCKSRTRVVGRLDGNGTSWETVCGVGSRRCVARYRFDVRHWSQSR